MKKLTPKLSGTLVLFSLVTALLALALANPARPPVVARASAPGQSAGDIFWSEPLNISNTPDNTSTDPFLVGDPAGMAHLFWAEQVSQGATRQPDTIMYAAWDGLNWSKPVDIFFAPLSDGTPFAGYPHAVLDDHGWLHLIWMSEPNFPNYAINYSRVPVWLAGSSQAWSPRVVLADNLSGTKYSLDISYLPGDGLHVVYASGAQGSVTREARSVTHISSSDYGETWSEPSDIFTFPDNSQGASDTRLLLGADGKVFVTWTIWDQSGNGQAIYLLRSEDNGETWGRPQALALTSPSEYERDWNRMAWMPDGALITFYEGGYRAYPYARYSQDEGATWGEAVDTFPWLIGENGYADFVQDSSGTMRIFLARRVREGSQGRTGRGGLWYAVAIPTSGGAASATGGWRWSDPFPAGPDTNMINPKTVIINGNRVLTTWYVFADKEIMVISGKIATAPELPSKPWSEAELQAQQAGGDQPAVVAPAATVAPRATPTLYIPQDFSRNTNGAYDHTTTQFIMLLLGVAAALIAAVVLLVLRWRKAI